MWSVFETAGSGPDGICFTGSNQVVAERRDRLPHVASSTRSPDAGVAAHRNLTAVSGTLIRFTRGGYTAGTATRTWLGSRTTVKADGGSRSSARTCRTRPGPRRGKRPHRVTRLPQPDQLDHPRRLERLSASAVNARQAKVTALYSVSLSQRPPHAGDASRRHARSLRNGRKPLWAPPAGKRSGTWRELRGGQRSTGMSRCARHRQRRNALRLDTPL
jgi:hypothetical protein